MEVVSNGPKWNGQAPDELGTLLELLAREPLDPTFEGCGGFVADGQVSGNFIEVSHVFNIRGTNEELAPLALAIRANLETDAYKAARAARLARIEARPWMERWL